jgi:hypothetical protein
MMRKFVFLVLAACICGTSTVHADVYVKKIIHRDEFYSNGVVTPAADIEIGMWFAGNGMAYHGENWIGVIDTGNDLLYLISKHDSVYFELPLPVDRAVHVSEELDQTLNQYFIEGTAEKKDGEKTILGRRCAHFTCKEDITFEEFHFYDGERSIWVTEDVPFDWTLWNDMQNAIRIFFRPREEYLAKLGILIGFELAGEIKRYDRGEVITVTTEVVEITDRDAPGGTYAVPEGFSKREMFERSELISLRGIIYIY